MPRSKPAIPKGTRDFGPEVAAKRNFIIEKIRKNFYTYGFSQLETPAMENLSVLTGKYGEEGDQLMFKILNSGNYLNKATSEDFDKGSRHLVPKIAEKGLRYDLTVPFARFVVMNQHEIAYPFKRFQIQPVWRADRPQKGRYREFYQCDADIIGSRSTWNETELTLLIHDVFNDLGLVDFEVCVNHREILFMLARYAGLERQEVSFCAEIDKMEKIGAEEVEARVREMGADPDRLRTVMGLFDISDPAALLKKVRAIDDENQGIADVVRFFDILGDFKDRGLKVKLDLSLARGLSYYTGMIYEVKATSVRMGSICGGGRYDNLTGVFGLEGISGIGISFGLDRIYDVMRELSLFPANISQAIDVLVIHFSEENFRYGQQLVMKLRTSGIKADLYPEPVKIQKQFSYANKIKAPFVIIIGDEEMNSGTCTLKDMVTGEQSRLTSNEVVKKLRC